MVYINSHFWSSHTVTGHRYKQSQIIFFEDDNLFFSTDLNISQDTKGLKNKI